MFSYFFKKHVRKELFWLNKDCYTKQCVYLCSSFAAGTRRHNDVAWTLKCRQNVMTTSPQRCSAVVCRVSYTKSVIFIFPPEGLERRTKHLSLKICFVYNSSWIGNNVYCIQNEVDENCHIDVNRSVNQSFLKSWHFIVGDGNNVIGSS